MTKSCSCSLPDEGISHFFWHNIRRREFKCHSFLLRRLHLTLNLKIIQIIILQYTNYKHILFYAPLQFTRYAIRNSYLETSVGGSGPF
jgi:hypothetical protein